MAKKSKFQQYAEERSWSGEFKNLDDMEGIFALVSIDLKESSNGFWGVGVKWKVEENLDEDGVNVDAVQFNWLSLESEKGGWNPYAVKKFFDSLDAETPEFDDLEDVFETMVEDGLRVQATLETKNEYQNFNISAVLDGDADGDTITEDEINEMDKTECKKLAKENDIKLTGKNAKKMREQLIEELCSADSDDEVDEDEINEMDKDECKELAEKHDITLKGKTVKKMRVELIDELCEEDAGGDGDSNVKALVEFITANLEDEVSEDMTEKELKTIIEQYTFTPDELEDDEIKFLKSVDLGDIIEKAKKKKK